MRLKLIACEILYRECCRCAAESPLRVDVEFLPKGLHDLGSGPMLQRLQEAVDRVDPAKYEAILLGYALCGKGLVGLRARTIPLIVPRAHDCITLFLGSRQAYLDYFQNHPGVYFLTTGWMERGDTSGDLRQQALSGQSSIGWSREELAAKYGEENADFLYSQIGDLTKNYRQFTFIRMGIGPEEELEKEGRQQAETRGWKYDAIPGNLDLLKRLLDGSWNTEDYITVPPGYCLTATYGDDIFSLEARP